MCEEVTFGRMTAHICAYIIYICTINHGHFIEACHWFRGQWAVDTWSSESEFQGRNQFKSDSRSFAPRSLFLLPTYKGNGTAAIVSAARKQLVSVGRSGQVRSCSCCRLPAHSQISPRPQQPGVRSIRTTLSSTAPHSYQ